MSAHQIRPGLALHWGIGCFHPGESAGMPPAAVFIFALVDVPGEVVGSDMTLIHGSALAPCSLLTPSSAFQVAVILSDAVLQELIAEDQGAGALRVRALARGEGESKITLPISPGARLAVESIRRCPFVGALRAVALAARCNDLLFEFLSALTEGHAPRASLLTRSANHQVHAAADSLKRLLEEPPSLTELARQVGLSETNLKRGFRQVFGTTAFGYLRERRMERARALLETGEATVLEAAARVGYSNPSNFAAAFRRQFGVNPKSFQLTARR